MTALVLREFERIVRSCVGADSIDALDEASLGIEFAELGLDSLAVYEIVTRIQDELHVTITDEEIDVLTTPGKLIDFVNSRLRTTA